MFKFGSVLKKFNKISFFPKLLIVLIFAIVLPAIIISIVVADYFTESLENEICKSNLDILRQTRISIESILDSTEQICIKTAAGLPVQRFMDEKLNITDFDDINIIKNSVNTVESLIEGTRHIENIKVYSFLNNMLITSEKGIYQQLDDVSVQNIRKIAGENSKIMWIEPNTTGILGESSESIRLVKFFYNDKTLRGFVLVTLLNQGFTELINDIYLRKSGQIFIIGENGSIIVNKDTLLNYFFLNELEAGKKEGWKKINNGKRTYLVSYTSSSYNKWRFVAVLPSDELDNKAYEIRNSIILFCMVFLIVTLFISLIIKKEVYNPVSSIVSLLKGDSPGTKRLSRLSSRNDEFGHISTEINNIFTSLSEEKKLKHNYEEMNQTLIKKLEENTSYLKNYFLYRIINGNISGMEEIKKQADYLNIPYNSKYVVIIILFDKNYYNTIDNTDNKRKIIINNRIIRILEKSIKKPASIKAFAEIREGSNRIIGVISIDSNKQNAKCMEEIKVMCDFVKNIIYNNFKFTVTLAIGGCYTGIEQIRKSYDEAIQTLKYKFIMGHNSVILKEDVQNDTVKTNLYYNRRYIKNCLVTGDIDKMKQFLNRFKEKSRLSCYNSDYKYYCKDIINVLMEYLNEVNYSNTEDISELNNRFLNFERQFESIDDATDWIFSFSRKVVNNVDNGNTIHTNKWVKRTVQIIEREYNRDLSLSDIAQRLSVTEQYLSKLFKKETGKNFKEYLTDIKLNKAKEYLYNTDISITSISEKVGYNNIKQFGRMFKKMEGITPVQYRELREEWESKNSLKD